jgi:hypothetical protein
MTQLDLHRPQWPVRAFNVSKLGAFGAQRTKPKEGSCGTKPYPCTHRGADLSAPEGTPVYVPFDGWVLYHGPADKAPFVGYGPWVALIAHADRHTSLASRIWEWATGPLLDIADMPEGALSVRYSLIGHLAAPGSGVVERADDGGERNPAAPPRPIEVAAMPLVADIWDAARTTPNPDHWRVQKNAKQNVVMYTDADGAKDDRLVFAGQKLGHVSDKNHVHWELRTSPIQPAVISTWKIDPVETFRQAYNLALPAGAKVPKRGGGGGGMLLLLAALAMQKRKRGGRRSR